MARRPDMEQKEDKQGQVTENKEAKQEEKVYNFTSSNKFLTVASLGVQFINGKASTKDLSVARALATIDGVERVE